MKDRLLSMKLELDGVMINIVPGNAPKICYEMEERDKFFSPLDEVVERKRGESGDWSRLQRACW